MLTQCPGCQTVFRVTGTILRAAHGQVRCGRCDTQFDAIEQLLDGEDALNLETSDATHNHTSAQAAPLSHEEIVLEGNRIEISGVYQRVNEDEAEDHQQRTRTVIEEFNIGTEEWENPFERSDDSDADDPEDDETELEDVEQELAASSLADAMASLDATPLTEHAASTHSTAHQDQTAPLPANDMIADIAKLDSDQASDPARTSRSSTKASINRAWSGRNAREALAVPELEDIEPFAMATPPRRWPWLLVSTVLTMVLLAQAVHHSRDALVRHPSIGPTLSRAYAAIGQPLAPQWQLQAYSIKQWGIVADPQQPGTLRVRASVTNAARFAQPYPLLQLTLEDRFGGQVGARAFTPEEYLGSNAQATRMLAAGEAASIDLAIVDPGQDAVGFQFDTCLTQQGGLECTHQLLEQRP